LDFVDGGHMRFWFLVIISLLVSCDYFTDQKVIVLDKTTKQPIDGVKVSIKDWDLMTDSLGFCHFHAVTGDLSTRPIEARKIGYTDFSLIIERDGGYINYKQKIGTTYVAENSLGAMKDTLIIYLTRK
jgi:hypothetical protein